MSAFLGKIHYLLYDKIQLQEYLYHEMIQLAKTYDIDINSAIEEAESSFGKPLTQALEDIVNHQNIHGSLQSFIHGVESRQGMVTLEALKAGMPLSALMDLYKKTAFDKGRMVYNSSHSPYQLFMGIYSHLLDGMPCDRVNQVLENDEASLVWETQTCLHERYWDNQVDIYYLLTDAFIRGFVEGASGIYHYERQGQHKKLSRKEA